MNLKNRLFFVVPLMIISTLLTACDRKSDFLEVQRPIVVPPPRTSSKAAGESVVSGQVKDKRNALALVDSSVELFDVRTKEIRAWARTNSDGAYVIPNILPGSYFLRFSKAGYVLQELAQPGQTEGGKNYNVDVNLSESPNIIQGRVTDEQYQSGIDGVTVQLQDTASGSVVASVTTNSYGRYAFADILSGNYKVFATKVGYFDKGTDKPGAVKGGNLYEADIVMTQKKISIHGIVKDFDSKEILPGVEVVLLSQSGSALARASTDAEGKYSFSDLEAKYYNLRFSLNGYGTETVMSPGQTIGGNDYSIDAFMRSRSNTVVGRVVDASNARPLANVQVQLLNASNGVAFASVLTNSYGEYQIASIPSGTYKMLFGREAYADYSTDQPGAIARGQSVRVDAALSPKLRSGQFRIVLTWTGPKTGAVMDVDSYLQLPGIRKPLFFKNMNYPGHSLDVDDKEWTGPETITIDKALAGVYHYYVVNYDSPNDPAALGNSDIIVTVYSDSGMEKQYKLNGGSGLVYEFFRIEDGRIVDVNKYSTSLPHCTSAMTTCNNL